MNTQRKEDTTPPEDKVTRISSARKLAVLALAVLAIVAIIYALVDEEETTPPATEVAVEEPQFQEEGSLVFLNQDSEDTLARIAIEVAKNEEEREQGLMYRSQMAADRGMLFVFPNAQPRAFWMKNTKIPLDIIYVDQNKAIVNIHKSAMPYSTQSVPSGRDAMYVVEVNEGFTTRHDIKVGDHIGFDLSE